MGRYISGKNSWFRFLSSFLPAAGTAALLCVFFDGPRLGSFYDFLLKRRPPPPVSSELLIIDSSVSEQELGEDILEPGAASSLLYTMTELGAETLIMQVPVLGLSAGGSAGEDEILYRFDEEFSILSKNIRNLFDAIRTGSVAPGDAARYVGELVELSDKGKERLVAALVRRDEEGIISMEKAAAFFGHARRPSDLRVQLIRSGESGESGTPAGGVAESGEYSRVTPDRDGTLRRVAPEMTVPELSEGTAGEKTLEHIIYAALKPRFNITKRGETGSPPWRPYPALTAVNGSGGERRIIPLDRNGAVLFEIPRKGAGFRQISVSDFLAYDEADRTLRRLLSEGEALGIFQGVEGEDRPGILYDYALSLREEGASLPGNGSGASAGETSDEKKLAWIDARSRYFAGLDKFLYGPAEMNLVGGYEEIIGSELTEETSIARMTEMRDSVIHNFVALREKHRELLEIRDKLESALSSSFCILGNTADVEASALLANSILAGRAIAPGDNRYLFFGTLLLLFALCFFIKSMDALSSLGIGALSVVCILAGFSLGFILSGIWFNPLIPGAAAAAGVFVSFVWAAAARARFAGRFRHAYGSHVSRSCLRGVIRAGNPLPSQVVTVEAAVIAIKYSGSAAALDARELLDFRQKASAMVREGGGTVTGVEGEIVTACFGSPLERVFLAGGKKTSPYEDKTCANTVPVLKAVDFVSALAGRSECASWHFGLDMGKCAFAWTALSGYCAVGVPVQRAAVLSRMAGRYKARVVISAPINEAVPSLPVRKLDSLKGKNGEEPFYSLTVKS